MDQKALESRVDAYSYHNHPIEKSIYLSKEGEHLPHPLSHYPPPNPTYSPPPREKGLTISQVNTTKKEASLWDFLSCCREDSAVRSSEYQDCFVCNRRVSKEMSGRSEGQQGAYTSAYRMRSRQGQPVQVFYDRVKSHELCGQRYRRD